MRKHVLAVACGTALVAGCAGMMDQDNPTASATFEPRSGSNVRGSVTFTQVGDVVRVSGQVTGHTKGPKGMHIHENGDCSDHVAMFAGGHFNPGKSKHGGPYDPVKHAGDLGNINFNDAGVAKFNFTVGDISMSDGPNGIRGRAVIVHAARDDMKTNPAGDAGARVACGVIK